MVTEVEAEEPEYAPVPDPLQLERISWLWPLTTFEGVVTPNVAEPPALYHPAPEGEP